LANQARGFRKRAKMDAAKGSSFDPAIVASAANIAETLANLHYLICVEARNPELVIAYANQAEERVAALLALLRVMAIAQ
jgi:hypothetical protein